jgi:four helix bundle protein
VRALPRDIAADSVIRQVARSAGSMSESYRAACFASSRPDFVAKLALTVEQADEADQWLWMASQLQLGAGTELDRLVAEGKELRAILSSSLTTARRNLKRELDEARAQQDD